MIDLLPDDQQQDLLDAVRGFLAKELPSERLGELAAAQRSDEGLWRRCAAQGWYGLGLAEEHGGVGLGVVEEALLFRELGRALVPGPVLATVLAAHLAAAAGESALAGELASGARVAGLAESRPGEEALLVWDAGPADLLLVVDAAGQASLCELDAAVLGEPRESIDPLHRLAAVDAGELPAALATGDGAWLARRGTVLTAACLAGIAEACRDLGAEFVKEREQFGRPIGAFQAVKHRAADTALRAEAAWSQTALAALGLAADSRAAAFQAAAAKTVAADAAIANARDTIQNHGAIGFTAELDLHLYLKRAHILEHTLGDTRHHLSTVLEAEDTS